MIFKAVKKQDDILSHHGTKGMKWGILNLETKFKYGLTDVSPAAKAAQGNTVDPQYKQELQDKLTNGDISYAEYRNLTMQNLMNGSENQSVDGMSGSSESTEGQKRNYVQEAMAKAAELGTKQERKEREKAEKEAEKQRKAEEREAEKQRKAEEREAEKARKEEEKKQKEAEREAEKARKEEEKKQKEKEKENKKKEKKNKNNKDDETGRKASKNKGKDSKPADIDEGPMEQVKSKFFEMKNRQKTKENLKSILKGRSSKKGTSDLKVQRRKRSLKKSLAHSIMVDDLKRRYLDE